MLWASIKRFRVIAGALTIFAIGGAPAGAADSVNLALDWVVGGVHAGYYVAQNKGYYKDSGLDVTIARGFGSGDTIKRVAAGSATFGIADTSALITALANQNVPVKIVAMVYDRATVGLIYLKESGIRTPKDLKGRKIGRSASGASVNMFPAFLKANNLDRSEMREVVVDGATFLPLLMSGQVDAVLEQTILVGKFERVAAKEGKTAVGMPYSQFGLEAYGNAIMASASTIEQKGDLVERFVAASMKGIAYALAHPDESIAILRQSNPELSEESAKDDLVALKEMDETAELKKKGLGYVDQARMEKSRDNLVGALSLKRSVPVDEIYTDKFLPKTPIVPGSK